MLLGDSYIAFVIIGDSIALWKEVRLEFDEDDEQGAIPHIAKVTDEVVEVCEDPQRSGTAIVEVAFLHTSQFFGSLLVKQNLNNKNK